MKVRDCSTGFCIPSHPFSQRACVTGTKCTCPSMLPLLSSPLASFSSLHSLGAVSPRPEQSRGFLGRWHLAPPTTCHLLHPTFCAAQLPADGLNGISSEVALHGVLTAQLQG